MSLTQSINFRHNRLVKLPNDLPSIAVLGYVIIVCAALGMLVTIALNQTSNADFLRSSFISLTYALSCGLFVVFPMAQASGRLKKMFKKPVLWLLNLFLLTAFATLVAEIFLAAFLFNAPFVPFGPYHMLWLNLPLSALSFLIVRKLFLERSSHQEVELIRFRTSSGFIALRPDEIVSIYAKNKFAFVVTKERELLADMTLKKFEAILPENFVQISRSRIINSNYISNVLRMKTGDLEFTLGEISSTFKSGISFRTSLRERFEL